jgi:hypothetical protein
LKFVKIIFLITIAGDAPKQLKVVHEAVPTEQALPAIVYSVLRLAGAKIVDWVIERLLRALRAEVEQRFNQFIEHFRKAADDPADGVTLAIVFQGPSFFEKLRKLIASPLASLSAALGLFDGSAGAASISIEIKPGFNYW